MYFISRISVKHVIDFVWRRPKHCHTCCLSGIGGKINTKMHFVPVSSHDHVVPLTVSEERILQLYNLLAVAKVESGREG